MRVKICGQTNLADARAAVEAGADLLGFNFYRPSPRYVEPATAAQIIAALRAEFGGGGYLCVGVLVNMPLAEALALCERCGLDLLQLHGDETVEYCEALAPYAFKALRPRSLAEAADGVARFGTIAPDLWAEGKESMARPAAIGLGAVTEAGGGEARSTTLRPRSSPKAEDSGPQESVEKPRFLIDASHPQLYGGTGATGDWMLARAIAARFPILLAGGLTPDNVGDAIRAVRPWGVDVASGVERAPGVKDERRVREFVRAAREMDTNRSDDGQTDGDHGIRV